MFHPVASSEPLASLRSSTARHWYTPLIMRHNQQLQLQQSTCSSTCVPPEPQHLHSSPSISGAHSNKTHAVHATLPQSWKHCFCVMLPSNAAAKYEPQAAAPPHWPGLKALLSHHLYIVYATATVALLSSIRLMPLHSPAAAAALLGPCQGPMHSMPQYSLIKALCY
jgi:hypothetical protein